jgi:hypothetical protein
LLPYPSRGRSPTRHRLSGIHLPDEVCIWPRHVRRSFPRGPARTYSQRRTSPSHAAVVPIEPADRSLPLSPAIRFWCLDNSDFELLRHECPKLWNPFKWIVCIAGLNQHHCIYPINGHTVIELSLRTSIESVSSYREVATHHAKEFADAAPLRARHKLIDHPFWR